MSPRAAAQLEHLGFGPVYDYVGGKADWIAAGLPTERHDDERRAIDDAERDIATCAPSADAGTLPDGESVIVVDGAGVVLGRIRQDAPRSEGVSAAEIMEVGPTSVRAHEPLDALLERMRSKHVAEVLVTSADGVLLGVVRA